MIMPKNPRSLMNCQTSGGRSARLWVMSPIVQHGTQLLDFIVQKGLLPSTQSTLWKGQQLVPIRIAAEQLAIPPHRTCVDRFLFGGGNLRQNFAEEFEHCTTHHIAAHKRDTEEHDK